MLKTKSKKLKNKILFLLLSIIIIMSIFVFFIFETSFSDYDSLIYEQSADILNLAVSSIEIELSNIETLSYNILIDTNIQSLLSDVSEENSIYQRHITNSKLEDLLVQHIQNNNYITSIYIVDPFGQIYSAGYTQVENDNISEIIINSRKKDGKLIWIPPSSSNIELIAARDIRKVKNNNLDYLGTIFFTIDLDKLLNQGSNRTRIPMSELIVILDNKIIHSPEDIEYHDLIELSTLNSHGYYFDKIDNEEKLISYNKSDYSNFTYLNIVSYNDIFIEVINIRKILIISIIIIIILAIIFGTIFTYNITKPLELLSTTMQSVENNEFNYKKLKLKPYNSNDEIGILYEEFNIMIKKINTLINENYIKQLNIKDTKYRMLQAQINPHFLYNTLDAINWMARSNKQTTIAKMVKSLGSILRKSINNNSLTITLKEEIELIEDYIYIQKIRYDQRLQVNIDINENTMDFIIPKMCLQPLVENAINYALEDYTNICKIKIESKIIKKHLYILVNDNGPGMSEEFVEMLQKGTIQSKKTGIGIKNIKERLQIMYGENEPLIIESILKKGTKITIKLPLVKLIEYQQQKKYN